MAYPKGRPRPEGAGRKKGTQNRLTVEAREAIRLAAEGLGGVDALMAWARESPDKFWTLLYTKLVPHSHEGSIDLKVITDLSDDELEAQAKAAGLE
jgi:hypothetical protein